MRCFPGNILMLEPKYLMGVLSVVIYFVMAFWLNSQKNYGPDHFLPRFMKKEKYDYMRVIHQGVNGEEGAMEVLIYITSLGCVCYLYVPVK